MVFQRAGVGKLGDPVVQVDDVHVADGNTVTVVDRSFEYPVIAGAADAPDPALHTGAGALFVVLIDRLDVVPAANSLARLRPVLDDVLRCEVV